MAADDVQIRLRMLGAAVFARDAKLAARSLDDVGDQARDAGRGMAEAGASADRAGRRISSAGRRSAVASAGFGRVGKSASTMGTGLAGVGAIASRGFMVIGAAGAAAAYGIGKATIGFDAAMRNVNSIAQLNEKQFGRMGKQVLALAGPTAQAPETLAKGLYDLVSSGFDARDSMRILEKSARAATAGLTTTEVSTGAVAAVLNAYHLPARAAGKISDQLFRTVDRGVISFEQLASTVGDVLPFASSLGVGLDQVGASVATMTKAGISAPETMTRIKAAMTTLLKPGVALSKTLKTMGFESGEALIKQKGFQGALEALAATTGGSKQKLAALFPNVRALGAALALTGDNSKTARDDLAGMGKAGGATGRALAQQSKSVSFQWNKLKSTVSALAITFGSKLIPVMRDALGYVGKLLSKRGAIGQFMQGVQGIKPAQRITRDAQGHVTRTTVPTTGAQRAGRTFRNVLSTVGDAVRDAAKVVFPALVDAAKQLMDALKPAAPFLKNVLLPLLKGIGEGVLLSVVASFKVLIPIVRVVATVLGQLGTWLRPVSGWFEKLGLVAGFVGTGPMLKVLAVIPKVGFVFKALAFPVRLVTGLVAGVGRGVVRVAGIFDRAISVISRFAGTFTGVGRRVVLTATNMVSGTVGRITRMIGVIRGLGGRFFSAGTSIARRLWDGIKGVFGSGVGFAADLGKALANSVIGFLNSAIPDRIPVPGAPDIGLPANPIPRLARGGVMNRGGLAVVGERGPELVRLPGQSRVYSNAVSFPTPPPGPAGRLHVTLVADGRVLAEGVARHEAFAGSLA